MAKQSGKFVSDDSLHGPDKLNPSIGRDYAFGNSPSAKGAGALGGSRSPAQAGTVKVPPKPPQEG